MRNTSKGTLTYKRCLVAFLLVALLLAGAASSMAATQYATAIHPNGGTTVNVRSCPDYMASSIMFTVPVGTQVKVECQEGDWYGVYVNGTAGYIHMNFIQFGSYTPPVQPTAKPVQPTTETRATVIAGPINLHEKPDLYSRVLTQLSSGATVYAIQCGKTWTQVRVNNLYGYVLTQYLDFSGTVYPVTPTKAPVCPTQAPLWPVWPDYPIYPTPVAPLFPVYTKGANATVKTNGGNLNLRAWADEYSSSIGIYANGSRVRVLTHGATWCYVQAGEQYGYMSTKYLSFDGGALPTPNNNPKTYSGVVNNPGAYETLNLRKEPSLNALVLGQYYNGTQVTVLGVGTEWLRVKVGGVEGYMMTKYVRVDGSASPHKTVVNKGSYVNLRTGPSLDAPVITQVREGASATVVIPFAGWSRVIVKVGNAFVAGYMSNSFLK